MEYPVALAALAFMNRIMDETGQSKLRLTFHGGEPLMASHSFFEEILDEIDRMFAGRTRELAMQSNLWLLDDRFCSCLRKHHVSLGTSLDGPEHINDMQRGPGAYARTMAGIERARSAGFAVNCIATFTKRSITRWEEIFNFFRSHGLSFSLHPAVSPLHGKRGVEIDARGWGNLLRQVLDRYAKERHHVRIETLDQLCRSAVEREGAVCALRDCFGMFLVIDPYGDIYHCQRMAGIARFKLGSIFDHPTMDDLVTSQAAFLFLEREKRIRIECGGCDYFEICKGGCAYDAFSGGKGAKDPLCEAWKGIFKEIHKRLSEEMETPENITLLAERGLRRDGHPLIHSGAIAELGRRHQHPTQTLRNARRIVAAVELARCSDMDRTSRRLIEMGISRTVETARASLKHLRDALDPLERLNKLYLHVTFRCQLQCTHCYAQARDDRGDHEMSPDELSRLVMEGAVRGFQGVVITGGEPLMHRDLRHILGLLTVARPKLGNTKLILRTNLSMPLSLDDMTEIASAFDEVTASIDGNQEMHNARRGMGSFRRLHQNLMQWVGHFRNRDGRTANLSLAAALKSEDARGEAGRSIWAFAQNMGIRHVKLRPLLPLGRARGWTEPPTTEILHMNTEPWEVLEKGFSPCATCGMGQNLYVEPDGAAFPCYAYHNPHTNLGNVCSDGLGTILDSLAFKDLSRRTVDTNRRCHCCDMRYICGGACRAWNGDATQFDLDAPPLNCDSLYGSAENIYREALQYLDLAGRGL